MKNDSFRLKIGTTYLEITSTESILECAIRNSIEMKHYCANGFCGACKIKLINGKVKLDHNGGISRANIADGYTLACCSFPLSDIEI
ncbi:2Fe-2S iron-sulfur cluster-binding protein [Citrobacter sp. JGM124]|uniref:2Fe-2S iron-sulfur cluster-binding protein n=1 Tax=Citrobacter sp. JGM124 TaxID=2799789 RepID=UPI001BA98185|nr:2Fe-2S iron-sulfur cluster-binding protein [Citrobacter sp. JGM124]MBS0847419.1 2Fe-2S iron-sulfur cluster binding domain-containing protein [Citrobacter sp. JGM124]